jgi:hypothetical protein
MDYVQIHPKDRKSVGGGRTRFLRLGPGIAITGIPSSYVAPIFR